MFDFVGAGLIVIASDDEVDWINAAARAVLHRRDGLIIHHGRLRARCSRQNGDLEALIRKARDDSSSHALAIDRPDGRQPLMLQAASWQELEGAVVIALADPDHLAPPSPEALRQWFGLTPTEARLASLIGIGRALDDVCNELEISMPTGRTHLRHIFAKTGTSRQAELVALLNAAPTRFLPPPPNIK